MNFILYKYYKLKKITTTTTTTIAKKDHFEIFITELIDYFIKIYHSDVLL